MADKRISQLIERTDIANNDVLPIVASGATTTNKVTISTIQDWMQENLDVGVTSVGLSMPSAFTVTNSPVTTSGNISVVGAGTVSQYIRGDGSLADFPSISGGGSSVSYYLNGSVSQGTIGGIGYYEMNKTPILGTGTDFVAIADGYLASFITDAGDPSLLQIPGGNWNFETYFSASSGGGTPSFYIELYKVNSGGTATLIASNSATPELIAFGTTITPYFSTLAVPTTTLTLTDRLALRYYVARSGRTITLHTENSHLCQIITTFTTGLTALNGLTAQVQNFATGTSGTDFNISSASTTHTFNLPDASASNRGVVTTGTQTFAGYKIFNGTIGANADIQLATQGTALNTFIKNINATGQTSIGSNGFGFNNANNIYFSGSSKGGGIIAFSNTGNQTYTLQNASGTLAFTSDLNSYLPLTGGTLTGTLAGTAAVFSGSIDANNGTNSTNGIKVISSLSSSLFTGGIEFLRTTVTAGSKIEPIRDAALGGVGLRFLTTLNNSAESSGTLTTAMTIAPTGAATFSGTLNGTSASFTGNVTVGGSSENLFIANGNSFSGVRLSRGGVAKWAIFNNNAGTDFFDVYNYATSSSALTLASTGAATFSSSVTAKGDLFIWGGNAAQAGQITSNSAGGGLYIGASGTNQNIRLVPSGTGIVQSLGSFDVQGAATFSSSVTSVGLRSIDAANTWSFSTGSNASTPNIVALGTISGTPSIQGFNFGFSSNQNLALQPQSGNVGIGTASPSSKLSVDGDIKLQSSTATAKSILFSSPASNWGPQDSSIKFTPADGTNAATSLSFNLWDGLTNTTERMRITSAGNVGIGTASPQTTLSIETSGVQSTISPIITGQSSGTTYAGMYTIRDGAGDQRGLIFQNYTANVGLTEKMRITSLGFLKASNTGLYVFPTGNYHELRTNQVDQWSTIMSNSSSSPYVLNLRHSNVSPNNADNWFIFCEDSSAARFRVASNGNVTNTNGSYGSISDVKLKENITDASPKLDDLLKVKVRNYNLIGEETKQIGVIAQELEEVFPSMIDESEDFEEVEVPQLDEEGNEVLNEEGEVVTIKEKQPTGTTTKSVKYSVFVPMLIKAIQELKTEIDSLKNQIK